MHRRSSVLQVVSLAFNRSKEVGYFGMRYGQVLVVNAVLLLSLRSAVARDKRTSEQPGTADSQVSDRGALLLSTEFHHCSSEELSRQPSTLPSDFPINNAAFSFAQPLHDMPLYLALSASPQVALALAPLGAPCHPVELRELW